MPVDTLHTPTVAGRIWVHHLFDSGQRVLAVQCPNQIQYGWGYAAAQAFGRGNRDYRVRALYVEFENVAEPADAVTPPTFGRDAGVEYYDDLALSGSRDFLRVAMALEPAIAAAAGYETFFPEGQGNQLLFFGQTGGHLQGIHGREFSAGVNSKVYGLALAATPVPNDRTQDIIVARTYFPTNNQVVKLASSQIGLSWELNLM